MKTDGLVGGRKSQALVSILIVLTLVFALGAALLFHSRSLRDVTSLQVDTDQAYSLAKSGMDIAESFIANNPCGSAMDETYNLGEGTVRVEIDPTLKTITSTGSSGKSVRVLEKALAELAWAYCRKITIYSSKVPNTDQSNFPVLINATDSVWRDTAHGGHVAQSDAGDILFTSSDGRTKLDHEIEKYTPSTGELVAWVEVPTLSASNDTDIYIYYGNLTCTDQWNVAGTWDEAGNDNYVGVWHMGDSGPTTVASSTGINNGEQHNGVIFGATGKIEDTIAFAGNTDYVDCGNDSSLSSTEFTVAHWVKANSQPSGDAMEQTFKKLAEGGDYSNYEFSWDHTQADFRQAIAFRDSGTWQKVKITGNLAANTWYHIVGTYNGTDLKIYLNGALNNSAYIGTTPKTGPLSLWLGSGPRYGSFNDFDGSIDEVRISDTARGADWIKTSYNNQNEPENFMEIGPENPSCLSAPSPQ